MNEDKSYLEEFGGKQISAGSHWEMKYMYPMMRRVAIFSFVFATLLVLGAGFLLFRGVFVQCLILMINAVMLLWVNLELIKAAKRMEQYLKTMNQDTQEASAQSISTYFKYYGIQIIITALLLGIGAFVV